MDEAQKDKVRDYYVEKLSLAEEIVKEQGWVENEAGFSALVAAVFDKLAKDQFYLEQMWRNEERIKSAKTGIKCAEAMWVAKEEEAK